MFVLITTLLFVSAASAIVNPDLGNVEDLLKNLMDQGYPIDSTALMSVTQAQLDIEAANVQTNAAITLANSAFVDVDGALTLAAATLVDAAIITEAALELSAKLSIAASGDVKTANVMVLKANGALDIAANGKLTALALVMENSNKVLVNAGGLLKTAQITVAGTESELRGSFEVIEKHALDLQAGARLRIGAAANATEAAAVTAAIALKDAAARLDVAGDVLLKAGSRISGAGKLALQAHLDAQAASALECGALELECAAKLSLEAKADAEVALKAAGEAKLAGELALKTAADVTKVVLQHASRVGEFTEVSVNGEVVVARKRAVAASEWDVEYGDKETTISKGGANAPDGTSAAHAALSVLLAGAAALLAAF